MTHKYGSIGLMRMTIDIPDAIFRRAKSKAVELGISLGQFRYGGGGGATSRQVCGRPAALDEAFCGIEGPTKGDAPH